MKRALVGLAAVPVLGVALLGIEVQLARRGHDLEGAPLALDARLGGAGPALRVVWLGDSTASGVGASAATTSLPHRVATALDRPVDLRVLAVSGDRIDDVVADQLPAVGRADLVFVSVGANDVTHLTTRGDFGRAYRRLLDGLPPAASVVVLGVPDMGSPPRLAQPLRAVAGLRGRQLAGVIRSTAEQGGATFVDIAGATGPSFRHDPGRYFADDGYHPSDDGYRLWAEAVVRAVRSRGTEQ